MVDAFCNADAKSAQSSHPLDRANGQNKVPPSKERRVDTSPKRIIHRPTTPRARQMRKKKKKKYLLRERLELPALHGVKLRRVKEFVHILYFWGSVANGVGVGKRSANGANRDGLV